MKYQLVAMMAAGVMSASMSSGQSMLSLSEEEAVRLAFENNKALHASLMRQNYADAKSSEVNASRLPSLKFTGAFTRLSDVPPFAVSLPSSLPPPFGGQSFTLTPTVLDNYMMKASLEQPLFAGFRLDAAARAADLSAQASEQDHARTKAELMYNVRAAYWSLFKATEFKKVVDENVAQVKAHLKDVENLMNQGMATKNDFLKVQVQLSDAQLRQIEMNNNVELAMIGLNNAMGIPLQTKITIASDIAQRQAPTFTDISALLDKAIAQRPEIRSMEVRMKAAEAGVTAAKGGWYPQIVLAGNYYYNRPNQRYQPAQDVFKSSWDVTLAAQFDIWNWGKTLHQTDQASAQLEEAKDGLSLLKDGVTLEVTQNFLNLNQAKERISVAENGVAQAEENYRVTSKRFKEGIAQNTDLLDAEVALLQAKTQRTQAQVDCQLAVARLQKAIGE